MTALQTLMQWEAPIIYSEMAFPVVFKPNLQNGKGQPTIYGATANILAQMTISETGRLTDEGDRQQYHKMATLHVLLSDGPFGTGDEFTFSDGTETLEWTFSGSSGTNLMNGTMIIEVLSKNLYEIGHFRRAN